MPELAPAPYNPLLPLSRGPQPRQDASGLGVVWPTGANDVLDATIEPPDLGQYLAFMEARVAVLEQIARTTCTALERIERRLDSMDRRIDAVVTEHRADFRWLLGLMLAQTGALLGAMADGFH
jgi:hypothetical protein